MVNFASIKMLESGGSNIYTRTVLKEEFPSSTLPKLTLRSLKKKKKKSLVLRKMRLRAFNPLHRE